MNNKSEKDQIVETQAMIDQLIVKNEDNLLLMKKRREEKVVPFKILKNRLTELTIYYICHSKQ